jgi:uncharacterized membrane protein YkvA (DUF1232 family)
MFMGPIDSRAAPEPSDSLLRLGQKKPRGITWIPFLGDLVAMARLVRDRRAALWAKLLVLASMVYVVLPFDAVPDLAPIIGWLDDIGLVVVLRLLLHRQVEPYRYPLGRPPVALEPPAEPAASRPDPG